MACYRSVPTLFTRALGGRGTASLIGWRCESHVSSTMHRHRRHSLLNDERVQHRQLHHLLPLQLHHTKRKTPNNIRYYHESPCLHEKSIDVDGYPHPNTARVLLPTLGQNGTLILRSQSKSISQVQVVTQWRDDTSLELVRDVPQYGADVDGDTSDVSDLGSTNEINPFVANTITDTTFSVGGLQLTCHKDGITTSLGRLGSLVEVDVLRTNKDEQDAVDTTTSKRSLPESVPWKVVVKIPEKLNLTCQLAKGDISVVGKLEGDTHLATSNGNITAEKLRGHNVSLDNSFKTTADDNDIQSNSNGSIGVSEGNIYISKAVEARSIQIKAQERVRARMINGSDVNVYVVPSTKRSFNKLDGDDEGATIDIGSVYVSGGSGGAGEARLVVNNLSVGSNHNVDAVQTGLIRVKSSHGHITVHATTNANVSSSSSTLPLIDLGGVNGSCDVTLEAASIPSNVNQSTNTATRVHFGSMSPESISTITSRGKLGDIGITMDRKLDADIRMMSIANSESYLPRDIDGYSLTSDEEDDTRSVILKIDQSTKRSEDVDENTTIYIETDAFEGTWGFDGRERSSGVDFTQGTMSNRSGEPDSRFDVRSRGKINIDGAASQALHGFRGSKDESQANGDIDQTPRPLLTVATDGRIRLETLSWFGSIARRYGMEENERSHVGRQASRSPRLHE
ncbi:predicted protein [Thalassiosira pseudonana CCMP1335]|uniref:Adhesin domain-containing protein n=1 Tax=Thalassiosira pseudonana TaxID=35128 RepID=B8C2N2_THAPS|nr:predicted protein [Thalassiosira pseudonana CCMP1335]EED92416.1 predicted protein [Thalassiosira pseudonana CCMP1335]